MYFVFLGYLFLLGFGLGGCFSEQFSVDLRLASYQHQLKCLKLFNIPEIFSGFRSCLSSYTTNLEAAKISHRPEKTSQSIRQLKLSFAVPAQRNVSHGVCAAADERQQI